MNDATNAFLLAFPALFSIVNPVSGAFIFRARTDDRTHEQRVWLAGRIALFSVVVMMVALWAGSYLLAFFGITLAALRVGGGLIVAMSAWNLINAPEAQQARKNEQMQTASLQPLADVAFFPMTIPFTTGPGTISVAIALGAAHPQEWHARLYFFAGASAAALAIAALIWAAYRFADTVARAIGDSGSKTIMRLGAFLLLCIGTQIMIAGVQDVLRPILTGVP